jgi:uncharacterized repeat protein (TIGR04076 family)
VSDKVKLTILASHCRASIHQTGQEFVVGDICPPICHELWQCIYPAVYALSNGALLDIGSERGYWFEMRCPDNGKVLMKGERIELES